MPVAVITGSSSGLGREYINAVIDKCPEIDEIWMIARRVDRLKKIERQYPQKKFQSIGLDLSKEESYKMLEEMLAENKPDVRVLISNSGVATSGNFDEADLKSQMTMCDLNVKGATAVTHLFLPYLKQGSVILETCSVSSFAPNPHLNVYSATKAYLASFSTGLRQELKPRGINVCAVHPGRMNTEMNTDTAKRNSGAFHFLPTLDVKKLAAKSLAAAQKGKASYTQGAFYQFYRLLAKVLPHSLIVHFSKM